MSTFYLIRHCSATGQEPDAPLTEDGEQQALALADFFRDIPVDRIISSDYTRATASIAPLATSKQLTIETEPRLRERILSLEPRDDWFELLRHSFTDASFRVPGAESGQDATDRILSVIESLDDVNGTTVLVTHGNLLALLLQHVDNRFDFDTWRTLSNPDVYRLKVVDNSWAVERVWSVPACG
ncbi:MULTISPECIES: histidine phosphatase family protein [Exiguobacterium]|uniref:histidine phosphatase family protein n=1 Tax=Exiguobacterium TaxID=33986 RepID=UPI001BEC0B8F|nr:MULTISPECIES: histidine phosphatase family protein [Exiguobacterium]MCT4777171.1 histidine phosphatase family protein [Exiguobacterium aquaticum]MCT4789335.1 histidine phosphatase family protein [Exiguobacterium mexicanum]